MAAGDYFYDIDIESTLSVTNPSEYDASISSMSDDDTSSCFPTTDCEASSSCGRFTQTTRPRTRGSRKKTSPGNPHENHASCDAACRKRQHHAVIHCCADDTALARQIQAELGGMQLSYLSENYPARVKLLSDVTNKSETECLHVICKDDMTRVIIIIHSEMYRHDDDGSHTLGMRIINQSSRSAFDVVELFTDKTVMAANSSAVVQKVLYEPSSPAFKKKMMNILVSSFNDEQIMHDKIRRDCAKERSKMLHPTEKKNKCCRSQKKAPSTTDSQSPLTVSRNTPVTVPSSRWNTSLGRQPDETLLKTVVPLQLGAQRQSSFDLSSDESHSKEWIDHSNMHPGYYSGNCSSCADTSRGPREIKPGRPHAKRELGSDSGDDYAATTSDDQRFNKLDTTSHPECAPGDSWAREPRGRAMIRAEADNDPDAEDTYEDIEPAVGASSSSSPSALSAASADPGEHHRRDQPSNQQSPEQQTAASDVMGCRKPPQGRESGDGSDSDDGSQQRKHPVRHFFTRLKRRILRRQ